MMRNKILLLTCLAAASVCQSRSQTVDLVPVVAKPISRTVELPGEFQPFLKVSLHAKVPGFVEKVLVDRGSVVKEGQLLIELSAPEIAARVAEAESKVQAAESDRIQAEAQLAAAKATYERLKKASETPGAVAGNEVVQAEKQVEAAQALVRSRQEASRAAEAAVRAQRELETYLRITAPFAGVVTDRLVHPGALAGASPDSVLLVLQQVSRLRLVVAVPEQYVGGILQGARVEFRVPAFPDRVYSGTVARSSHARRREEPDDGGGVGRPEPRRVAGARDVSGGAVAGAAFEARTVRPQDSVVATTERTFVVRDRDGRAEWVDVRKGAAEGDLVEVLGDLKAGRQGGAPGYRRDPRGHGAPAG